MKNKFLYPILLISGFLICAPQVLLDEVVDVEISISKITKINDVVAMKDIDMYGRAPEFYEIIFNIYNPYADIAGFQFDLEPKGLFSFNKENIYGGASIDAGFNHYVGKGNGMGTVLGFSMQGNIIPASLESQIFLIITADIRDVYKYIDSEIKLENLVIASKAGKTLSSKFIPFKFEDIN